MVKLRFTRTGRKGLASYRVVAIDSRKSRDSKALEYVGHYSPHTKELSLNEERIKYWLSVGAQPSDTVARLLVKQGIIDDKALPKKEFKSKPGKKAVDRAAATPAPAETAEEAPVAEAEESTPPAADEETPEAEAPTAPEEPKEEPAVEAEEAPADEIENVSEESPEPETDNKDE